MPILRGGGAEGQLGGLAVKLLRETIAAAATTATAEQHHIGHCLRSGNGQICVLIYCFNSSCFIFVFETSRKDQRNNNNTNNVGSLPEAAARHRGFMRLTPNKTVCCTDEDIYEALMRFVARCRSKNIFNTGLLEGMCDYTKSKSTLNDNMFISIAIFMKFAAKLA